MSEHPDAVRELVTAYIDGGSKAAEAKSLVRLRQLGYSMPPPQTLQRWKQRFQTGDPLRGLQGGPRLTFLSGPGMQETLLRMVEVTRAKGLPSQQQDFGFLCMLSMVWQRSSWSLTSRASPGFVGGQRKTAFRRQKGRMPAERDGPNRSRWSTWI
jgi:hypothetical protein